MHNRSMLITASADQSVRLWKPDPSLAPFQTKPPVQKKGTLAYPSLMTFLKYVKFYLLICLFIYLFVYLFIYYFQRIWISSMLRCSVVYILIQQTSE